MKDSLYKFVNSKKFTYIILWKGLINWSYEADKNK